MIVNDGRQLRRWYPGGNMHGMRPRNNGEGESVRVTKPADWLVVISLITAMGGAVAVVVGQATGNLELTRQGAWVAAGGLAASGVFAGASNLR